jgi:hypothetical protein
MPCSPEVSAVSQKGREEKLTHRCHRVFGVILEMIPASNGLVVELDIDDVVSVLI